MQFSSSRWSPTVAAAHRLGLEEAAVPPMSFLLLFYVAIVVASCLVQGAEGLGSMTSMATLFSSSKNNGLEAAAAPVCGIHAQNQSIFCWNYNNNTPLQFTARHSAVAFSGLAGGQDFFCGLRESNGQPFCWALPNSSSSSNSSSFRPIRLSQEQYTQVVVGESQVCAIRATTGLAECWRSRSNNNIKQSQGQQGASSSPPLAKPFVSLTAGANFTCGLDSNWKVTCWGDDNGFNITHSVDAAVAQVQYQLISAGSQHVCGLWKLDGRLSCWGDNSFGQTMLASNSTTLFIALALGRAHSCGLEADTREAVCWGSNSFSQLNAPSGIQFASIAAGEDYTCGVELGNLTLICWGKGFSNKTTAAYYDETRTSQIASPAPPPPFTVEPGICQPSSSCLSGTYPVSSFYSNNITNSVAICKQPNNGVCLACSVECPGGYYESQSCGFQGDRKCTKITAGSPHLKTQNSTEASDNWRIVFSSVIGGVGSLAGLLSIAWCIWNNPCWTKKRRQHTRSDNNSIAQVHNNSDALENGEFDNREDGINRQRVQSLACSTRSRRDLLNKTEIFEFEMLAAITDNFSDTHEIGAGSFGNVYKAELPDGKQVAIKRADKSGKKVEDIESPFQTELESLTRVHHKHLVNLVGYCDDGAERILVYEFISNGTLFDHLHNVDNNDDDDDDEALNNWHVRIKIALQAARGIEYLHIYANPPLIHRDIKSSNILLDSSWTARVSDFGLSTMGPSEDMSHLSTAAAGTLGFIDPEYFRLQHLTTKSDVYSYGVVLLELLTGKRAIHQVNSAAASLVDIAVPSMSDHRSLLSILDTRLYAPQGLELEAIFMIAQVAQQCVQQEGKARPSMTEVVNQLEQAFNVSHLHKTRISAKSGCEMREIDLQMRDDADGHYLQHSP